MNYLENKFKQNKENVAELNKFWFGPVGLAVRYIILERIGRSYGAGGDLNQHAARNNFRDGMSNVIDILDNLAQGESTTKQLQEPFDYLGDHDNG